MVTQNIIETNINLTTLLGKLLDDFVICKLTNTLNSNGFHSLAATAAAA